MSAVPLGDDPKVVLPTEYTDRLWRVMPDSLALRLSKGTWQTAPHLALISYLVYLCARVGLMRRLLLNMPPGHGKTQLVLEWTPVWLLEHDPAARIIAITYGADLAEESGKNVRRLIDENADELAVRLRPDSQAANRWRTLNNGGMWTAGIDGAITGRRAKGLLIDDPHKNFEDAHSARSRERVWNFYRSTARNRLLPRGWIACVHTRWHESDLTGLLLEHQSLGGLPWVHVKFPAIAEEDETIETVLGERTCTMLRAHGVPLPEWHRPEGRALWPTMEIDGETVPWYDEAELDELRIDSGLYLQRPSSPTGSYFPVDAWQYADAVPGRCRFTRFWDLAATEGGGDQTVGALLAYDDEERTVYVVDIEAARLSSSGVKKLVRLTAERDRHTYGRKVRQVIEQEGGASGTGFAEDYVTDVLAGFTVETKGTTGDKEINAMPLASQQQISNVYLVRRESHEDQGRYEMPDWWGPFIEQCRAFPNGSHDDQVDAASHAFQDLIAGRKKRKKAGMRTTAGAGPTGVPGLPMRRAAGGLQVG
jgi:predicted phage terminase large subunit-like protein